MGRETMQPQYISCIQRNPAVQYLRSHSPVSPSYSHCVELTVDAAYSAVTFCSRAHFCQAQKVDLKGKKIKITTLKWFYYIITVIVVYT